MYVIVFLYNFKIIFSGGALIVAHKLSGREVTGVNTSHVQFIIVVSLHVHYLVTNMSYNPCILFCHIAGAIYIAIVIINKVNIKLAE